MLFIFHHDNLSSFPVRKKITLMAPMIMTEGFSKWLSESPFHLEPLAWVCTASCIDICFRLTHLGTKNVEGCSSSFTQSTHHTEETVWCTKKSLEALGGKKKQAKILLLTGRRRRKNWKEVSRETGVGVRNLPGMQADDSQNDFPFASDWQT